MTKVFVKVKKHRKWAAALEGEEVQCAHPVLGEKKWDNSDRSGYKNRHGVKIGPNGGTQVTLRPGPRLASVRAGVKC
jgi:hypothetical protein